MFALATRLPRPMAIPYAPPKTLREFDAYLQQETQCGLVRCRLLMPRTGAVLPARSLKCIRAGPGTSVQAVAVVGESVLASNSLLVDLVRFFIILYTIVEAARADRVCIGRKPFSSGSRRNDRLLAIKLG